MNKMQMHAVVSSNIAAAGYDEKDQIMHVRFTNGTKYEYSGIPKWVYEGIFTAESAGKFLHSTIKKAGYKFKKL